MSIPYQPTYSLHPKYGFRYGPSSFAPPQAPIAPPPPAGLQGSPATPPPVMGTQQGTAAPAYTQDPLQASGNNNGGFDYASSRIPQAQGLGYARGTQNPLGMFQAVPILGTAMNAVGAFDNMPNQTYGNYGTYDAQGNVFGPEGRAYDPITGRAVPSYANRSAAMDTITGGYSKLRDAGEGVISSALGSYDNSLYAQQEINPSLNTAQARAAMLRGTADARGLPTIQGLIEANTAAADPAYAKDQGYSTDDFDFMGSTPITADMLGFDGNRPMPTNISGKFGTQPGDIARTEMGLGVINESGQIETPQGTVVQMTDPYTGKSISLLGSTNNSASGKSTISAQSELARNQALDARSNPEGSGMSGFNVSDGEGGGYQTDSSGTAGAFTGGVTGMEDEYDEPANTGGNDNNSGGK